MFVSFNKIITDNFSTCFSHQVDPNTTVEFALSVEVYPATELLPVQVTCVADLDQGQAQNLSVGNMGEGLMNAFTFSHTFTYIPGGSLRTIQINCSNSISSQVCNCLCVICFNI